MKIDLGKMINPKKELFKWGPIDARFIYIQGFVEAFEEFPKFIDGTWPDILGYFKDDKVVFILDYDNLRDRGKKLFKKYILDEKRLKEHYDNWFKTLKKIEEIENKVEDLSNLSYI